MHRIRLLDRGGDDVITKPFSYLELRADGGCPAAHRPRQPRSVLTAGPVCIDQRQRKVLVDERPVELSAMEHRLLCQLASEPTRVFTRNELMSAIWGFTSGRTRTLDSHCSRLRAKLATHLPSGPQPVGDRLQADRRGNCI